MNLQDRHVSFCKTLSAKTVLIFGKGPTFDPRAAGIPDVQKGGKIYCVNQTAATLSACGLRVDLGVFHDVEALQETLEAWNTEWRDQSSGNLLPVMATPALRHVKERAPQVPLEEVTLNLHQAPSNFWFFDLWTAPYKVFRDEKVFFSPTTYASAFLIAAMHGARTIYTNGIDGLETPGPPGLRLHLAIFKQAGREDPRLGVPLASEAPETDGGPGPYWSDERGPMPTDNPPREKGVWL